MIKARLVSIGTRIPADLKKVLSRYCNRKGIKLQFFVTEALREKFIDMQQDEMDNAIVEERLKNSTFTDTTTLQKYIQARQKKS